MTQNYAKLSNAIIIILSFAVFFLFNAAKLSAKVNSKTKTGELQKLEEPVDGSPNVQQSNLKLSSKIFKTLKPSAPVGEVIGITTYDLQTNFGMSRRIAAHPNNRWFYVGWTMGRDFTAGPPNRGTGFNLYDNQSGMWLPQPEIKIEPFNRTGWPSIGFSQGRQFSIAHTPSQGIIYTWRPGTTNVNDWMEVEVGALVDDYEGLWARTATAGSNIYAIVSRNAYSGTSYGGVLGGLNFIRSTDNGNTWESLGGLEADYSNSIAGTMTADSYAIDATLDVVSVVYGGSISEILLYKSTNQGESWGKTVIQKSSNPLAQNLNSGYNYGVEDFTVDPFFGSSGNTIIIDSEGKSHVVFSGRIVYNTSSNNFKETFNYFIDNRACGLFYWNEEMEDPEIIGKTVMNDVDGDGELGSNLLALQNEGQPYYAGFVCQPQLGIDDENNLYVSYTANVDGHFVPEEVTYLSMESGGGEVLSYTQNYSANTITFTDVFMIKSTDGGSNWQGPLNVTNAPDSEETYPSIPRNIGDTIMLVYMHDPLPGILLRSHQEMATINEIAAVKILPEDINNSAAPPDSEPYFTAPNLTQTGTNFFMPQGCSLANEEYIQDFAFGMDYPDGIIKEFQVAGLADYSTPGFYTEGIFVEDSQGNISDTAYYNIEVLPDTEPPAMDFENCDQFSIVAGQEYTLPTPTITDYFFFGGQIEESGCNVSENLEIIDNIDIQTVGSYTATYTVSDFAGNSTSAEITVNVIESDTAGPQITVSGLPESINIQDLDMLTGITFSAVDNVACEEIEVTVDGLEALKNVTTAGTYTVTFTAIDVTGNETIDTYTVEVMDLSSPNNLCENATFIELSPQGDCEFFEIDSSNNNNDKDSGECSQYGPSRDSAPDIFFKIVVPSHGQIKLSTSIHDFKAVVYEDCDGEPLQCINVYKFEDEVFLMRDLPPGDTLILEIGFFNKTFMCVEDASSALNDICENPGTFEFTDQEYCNYPDFGTTTGTGITIENLAFNSLDKQVSCETYEYAVDLFYEFVAPPSGYIKIRASNSTIAAIYDSCSNDELYCKRIGNGVVLDKLNAGETYILQLFIYFRTGNPDFKFCVTEAFPTENNDCENAILIDVYEPQGCGEDVIPLDFSDNTLNLDYQVCATGDMFYKFVVPENGIVRVGGFLNSIQPSPQFSVYQNCNSNPLFALNCIDSSNGLIFDLPPFDTLILQLAGDRGTDYKFCLEKSIPTPNKNCSNAAYIEVLPFGSELNGKVFNYNNFLNTPAICEPGFANAFYEFVVPASGEVVFLNTNGSTSINLYNSCDDLYPFYVECYIEGTQAITNLTPGETLIMEIETPETNLEFDFGIQELNPTPNNTCTNATMIDVIAPGECPENSVSLNFTYNTADLESSCFTSLADAYYTFVVPESGKIKVKNAGLNNFYYALYNACDGEEIFCSSSGLDVADLTPGDNVILKVAKNPYGFGFPFGYDSNVINFCLEEVIPTANNTCENAEWINVQPNTNCLETTTLNLENNSLEKQVDCTFAISDAFYKFVVPPSGQIAIQEPNADIGFSLQLFETCASEAFYCNFNLIELEFIDDLTPGDSLILQMNTDYQRRVSEFCVYNACRAVIGGVVIGTENCNISDVEVIIKNENGKTIDTLSLDTQGNYISSEAYSCGLYTVELNESTLPACFNGNNQPITFEVNTDGILDGIDFIDAVCTPPQPGTFNCEE